MKKYVRASPILLAILVHGLNCNTNNTDFGPGNQLPKAACTLTTDPDLHSHVTLASAPPCTFSSFSGTCQCEDYGGQLPDNLINAEVTHTLTGDSDGYKDGCNWDTDFMWPLCSYVAEASGRVSSHKSPPASKDHPGDHDMSFDLCPSPNTMFVDDFMAGPMEIRAGESFIDGNARIGRIHIEVQECRLYDGKYTFTSEQLGTPGGPDNTFAARPQLGDLMSAAGDWITDNGVDHVGHTELHEARIIARVVPNNENSKSLILASGFFVSETRQDAQLHLDVFLPHPVNPDGTLNTTLTKVDCAEIKPTQQDPPCAKKSGVTVAPPPQDKQDQNNNARCVLNVFRGLEIAPLPATSGCWESCGSPNGPGFLEDSDLYCQSLIHFTGAFLAQWNDPADLWMCQCPCDDPSAPGATISAPVQGCAQMGLDPSKPEDQQTACA